MDHDGSQSAEEEKDQEKLGGNIFGNSLTI